MDTHNSIEYSAGYTDDNTLSLSAGNGTARCLTVAMTVLDREWKSIQKAKLKINPEQSRKRNKQEMLEDIVKAEKTLDEIIGDNGDEILHRSAGEKLPDRNNGNALPPSVSEKCPVDDDGEALYPSAGDPFSDDGNEQSRSVTGKLSGDNNANTMSHSGVLTAPNSVNDWIRRRINDMQRNVSLADQRICSIRCGLLLHLKLRRLYVGVEDVRGVQAAAGRVVMALDRRATLELLCPGGNNHLHNE